MQKEKEDDEVAKPSCLSPSTEHCSKQLAPLPFSRPMPAGGHWRTAPESQPRPAGRRGERGATAAAAPGPGLRRGELRRAPLTGDVVLFSGKPGRALKPEGGGKASGRGSSS